MSKILALSFLIFNGLFWGFSFSLAKITAENSIHPFGVTFWESLIASLIFLIFIIYLKKIKTLKINFKLLKLYIILSVTGIVLPGVLFFYSAAYVPAGILAILITLAPIITYAIALLIGMEIYSLKRILGVLIGFISVSILVFPEQTLPNPEMIPWIFVGCFCASCYAFQGIIISLKFNDHNNPIIMAFWMNIICMIILLPSLFFEKTRVILGFNEIIADISILTLGLIEALCFSLQMYLITRSGAVFASQVGYIVTISGVIWGIIIFKEIHSFLVFVSLILVLIGLLLVNPRKFKETD